MERIGQAGRKAEAVEREAPAPIGIHWDQVLVAFFRALAVAQALKGLTHWGLLLDGDGGTQPGFGDADTEWLAANIYFAVLDPVAAVGLWLTSSWGAVIWMLAAGSQIGMSVFFPEVFGGLWVLTFWNMLLIVLYGYLSWQVAAAGLGR